ncbi:hypothetical protein [Actinoplanes awajinensis]|nr:hypothetical protein [Actinoplanes awajinensis]
MAALPSSATIEVPATVDGSHTPRLSTGRTIGGVGDRRTHPTI